MITEDYISFEVAKLLKEKGFAGECSRFYMPNGNGRWKYGHYHDFDISDRIECPTLQMAMKWLREVHGLYMYTAFAGMEEVWFSRIYDKDKHQKDLDDFKTYEEACEAAIKYCLENLI